MRNKLLVFLLTLLMIGCVSLAGQVQAKQLLAKKPQLQQLPPRLQVQQFSGDFAKWVTLLQVDVKNKLRFRWMPRHSRAQYAMVVIQAGSPGGRILKRQKLNSIPKPNSWGQFYLNPFQLSGQRSETLYVSVRLWNGPNQPTSPPSNKVRIGYKKPSTTVTQFKLDILRVVRVSPQGPITGPPESSIQMNEGNSLKITYYYELVTENNADIRQWLILKKGSVAPHNFWYVKQIAKKGSGQITNLATIRCQTPTQKETKIYGVRYKMLHGSKVLKEGVKKFGQPIVFRCPQSPKPDRLWIKNIKPGNGASLFGPFDSQSFTPSNSLEITYGYELYSRDTAKVKQWALKANGAVAAYNFWTVGTIHRGVGEVKTGITIKCKAAGQSDTVIKYLDVKLIDPNSNQVILNFKHPVQYTFKCEKVAVIK